MAIREIIRIDEEKCDGCGQCVPSCVEGALKVINGKARLVSDVLCDGLGACLGHCPTGALTVIKRDAPEFDEVAASAFARASADKPHAHGGCPGSRVQMFEATGAKAKAPAHATPPAGTGFRHPANLGFIGMQPQTAASPTPNAPAPSSSTSRLRQWPVQLHLVPPTAPFFEGQHVLLAADCVPVAVADFHQSMLEGRSLAIACPKLDQHQEIYVDKLAEMIDEGGILSLTVAIMEVPCCGGLHRLAQMAMDRAQRKVPLTVTRFSIRGGRL